MKVKKRTSKLSGKKTHPVLTEKLTLDRANNMFLWNYTSFIIVLNNNSHPQPEKAVLCWIRIWSPKYRNFTFQLHDKDFYIIRPWVLYKNNF